MRLSLCKIICLVLRVASINDSLVVSVANVTPYIRGGGEFSRFERLWFKTKSLEKSEFENIL